MKCVCSINAMHHSGLSSLLTATNELIPNSNNHNNSKSLSYSLSIQPQPPRNVFVNQYFTVRLFLIDHKNVLKTGHTIPLQCKLYDGTNHKLCHDHVQTILQIDPDTPPVIGTDGNVSLRIKITELSMLHQNILFDIQFSQLPSNLPHTILFDAVHTTQFTVIRYQIKIIEQPPSYWYKDEGGRDKSIQLSCLLCDHNDELVKIRDIPLNIVLMYHNDNIEKQVVVKKQDILKLQNDDKPRISSDTGKCIIKFRIEEVSKNHQKQLFCIRMEPNIIYDPSNADIAADTSKPITILSKRNKRRKKDGTYSAHYTDDIDDNVSSNNMSNQNTMKLEHNQLNSSSDINLPSVNELIRTDHEQSNKHAEQLMNSMNGIIQYTQYTCKTLLTLEWQHIGFEVTENGALNLHRPIYRCPSCWTYKDTIRATTHQSDCNIYRLIHLYQNYTITQLNDMVTFLNNYESTCQKKYLSNSMHDGSNNSVHGNIDSDSDQTDHSERIQSHSPILRSSNSMHQNNSLHTISPNPNNHHHNQADLTSLNRNQSLSIPFLQSFSSIPPSLQQTLSFSDLNLPIHQHTSSDVNLSNVLTNVASQVSAPK